MAADPPLLHRAGAAAAGLGAAAASRPRLRRGLQLGLVGLVASFLVAFLATQWSRLPDYDWRFEPGWLALSAVSLAVFYLGGSELWRLVLRMLGERIGARDARAVYGTSLVARYVPTGALALVGRVVLAERCGVSKRACLASVAYEVGCALAAAVAVGSYFVITLPPLEDVPARYGIVAVVPLALAALHPRIFRPLADRALTTLGREPLSRALPFSRVLLLVALYALAWALAGLGVFAFAASLHPVSGGDLPYVAASYAVGFCVAVLTFVVPAGLGTRDATLAAALGVALTANVAIAIAVAFRIFQTAVELMYVGFVTALARRGRIPHDDLC